MPMHVCVTSEEASHSPCTLHCILDCTVFTLQLQNGLSYLFLRHLLKQVTETLHPAAVQQLPDSRTQHPAAHSSQLLTGSSYRSSCSSSSSSSASCC
jgi:hypothetical protein